MLLLADGQVELFFIDTSPFVQEYQTAVWSVNEGKLHQANLQGTQGCARGVAQAGQLLSAVY